jgi:hypothetical protein
MATRETRIDTEDLATRLIWAVLAFEVLLLVLDYVFNFFDVVGSLQIRRIFNIAREESLPTWFASLQAVLVALTAAGLVWIERLKRTSQAIWKWGFVAGFFLYVGIDDASSVHERLGTAFADAMPESSTLLSQFPTFSWHLFVAPFLGAALCAVAVLLWRLVPHPWARQLIVVGLCCFAVSQGLDFLEGIDDLYDGWAESLDVEDYTVAHSLRAVEEMLEMFGTTALWAVVLFHWVERSAGLHITLDPKVHRS